MITEQMFLDISPYKSHIEAALAYAGDTHSVDDVAAMIDAGHAQLWPGPSSVLVTELMDYPQHKTLNFFLAGGTLAELKLLSEIALDWGRSQGCTRATFVGRKGWSRSFLTSRGWTVSPLVFMEKRLDVR